VVHLAQSSNPSLLFASGAKAHWLDAGSLEVVHASDDTDGSPLEVREVAANPVAGLIAGEDGDQLDLIDERTRKVVLSLRDPRLAEAAHAGDMRAVGFGQNGSLLVTGANEDGIKIWEVASGTLKVRIPLPGSATTAPQFSPDGRWLASPADGRTVLYEVRRSDLVAPTALQPGLLEQFAYSPDGAKQLFATRASDELMEVRWCSPQGVEDSWSLPADWSAGSQPQFAWRSDGSVLCIPPGKPAQMLEGRAGKDARPVPEIGLAPRLAAWSRSGLMLWTVTGDSEIQVWAVSRRRDSADKFTLLREYSTRSMAIVTGRQTITCLAAAGERAMIALDNGLVAALDSNSDELRQVWPSYGNGVTSLAVASDLAFAAAGTDRGVITVFDLLANREIAGLTAFPRAEVASLALDPRGEWLVAASTTGVLRVWRRLDNSYELFATLREADGRRIAVAFHPARPSFAARVEGQRAIHIWRLDALVGESARLGANR
jgi:WD40 repeat protein